MADNTDENFEETLRIVHERQRVRSSLKVVCNQLAQDQPELNDLGSQKFSQDLKLLDRASERAEYTRELQLATVGLKHFSSAAKNQALRLNDLSRRYGFEALAEKLLAFHYPGREAKMNWTELGIATMALSVFLPKHDVMLGAIDKPVQEKKQSTRKRVFNEQNNDHLIDANLSSKPTEMTNQDQTEVDDSAALKRSALQLDHLRKVGGKDGRSMEIIDLLVDHTDTVQTIENFFDYSFLLKDKKVAEGRESKNGIPQVVIADANTLDSADKKQMILAVNMADLDHLVNEIRKHRGDNAPAHPLHRSSELYQCQSLPEQIQCLEEQAQKRQRRK